MKKLTNLRFFKYVTVFSSLLALGVLQLNADDVKVTMEKLPDSAQKFIKDNFPEQKTVLVMYDKEWTSASYEVTLDNGIEIEFSSKGEWLDIEGKSKDKLPDSVIPKNILSHIQKNFANNFIKEIARKPYGYKVELNGDIELRFDKEGKFLNFDD